MKIILKSLSCFIFLVVFFTGNVFTYISIIASVIHEIGHFSAAKLLKINLSSFKLKFFFARIVVGGNIMSYNQEIILCFSGPLFNFISAIIVYTLIFSLNIRNVYVYFFANVSVFLGLLNLLPVKTFDGGRILEAVLCKKINLDSAKKIVDILSFITIFLLWSSSIYFLFIYSTSLNLFLFCFFLFYSLFIS